MFISQALQPGSPAFSYTANGRCRVQDNGLWRPFQIQAMISFPMSFSELRKSLCSVVLYLLAFLRQLSFDQRSHMHIHP